MIDLLVGGAAHVLLKDRIDTSLGCDSFPVLDKNSFYLYKGGVILREWHLTNSNTIHCFFEGKDRILINSIASQMLQTILVESRKYT